MRPRTASTLIALFAPILATASNCSAPNTGFPPLNTPFFTTYKGFAGGLYPNGSNRRPDSHETGGQSQAALVIPRNTAGSPDSQNGKIVLLSIGMSNATQEFTAFRAIALPDREKNPRLIPVDGAQGGWSADAIVANPGPYWTVVEQRLQAAQATDQQVQAAWLKEADMGPNLAFPNDAQKLQSEIKQIIQMAKARFPNLRLVYLSSRIYAGYATSNLNPEPYAYQSGFAVKWLIEAQINGDPTMDYKSGAMPWIAWGPYLWADGTSERWDGLIWNCSDLMDDGTHPSNTGTQKVAQMLLDFFKGDTTTRPWFVAPQQTPKTPSIGAIVNAAGYIQTIAPGSIASVFGSDLAAVTAVAPTLPLPYGLEGTTVTVGGEPAPVYFVSPSQINFLIPAGGNGNTIVITREGTTLAALSAQMTLNAEGLFAVNAASNAAARHSNGVLVSTQNPAKPGETIELYGTGKGIRNPIILTPEILPSVQVGGIAAEVRYYGPAPIYPGLDQLNITIPPTAPAGSSVPVAIQSPFTSNTVTIAIAAGS